MSSDRRTERVKAWERFLIGAVGGLLGTALAADLTQHWDSVPVLGLLLVAAAAGAVALTRYARLMWGVLGVWVLVVCLAAYTPLFASYGQRFIRTDRLATCDAIVVLSAGVTSEGKLDVAGLERLLGAVEMANAGYAPVIIRTCMPSDYPNADADAAAFVAMAAEGVRIEVVGPVTNTYDEAVRTRELCDERGWDHTLLVTSPLHSARAAAVFEKAGLDVTSAPCHERDYSVRPPHTRRDRLNLFRQSLYETAAWALYRLAGRV